MIITKWTVGRSIDDRSKKKSIKSSVIIFIIDNDRLQIDYSGMQENEKIGRGRQQHARQMKAPCQTES